jgi:hypothetical protein
VGGRAGRLLQTTIRILDYGRGVVVNTGPKNTTSKETLRSECGGTLKNYLAEPTLLEMPAFLVNPRLRRRNRLSGLLEAAAATIPDGP